ncbi:PQQ-dependent sugar dehydrogenase [Pseudorhodoplanes sp.]|uniref:PQQ-dependent sugar dehydrogenase n=1 Tax=Pseudorhodoplanes sp. TaxID=1934341 RepID=UPI002CECF885|nr:PQQ-dependent sugar dehydrogenase [Pseudorhodoplanes sp.]HWV55234.1 PQQ-dependent sugar dehydrogenase [Pseudorhodoplanes sp.]
MKAFGVAVILAAASLPAQAQQTFKSDTGDIRVVTVVSGLSHPWALAFLPDGRMLVTERGGRMRIATRDGKLSPPLDGVPKVLAQNQGGLLDVIVDRDFANNRTIFFCYSDPVEGGGAQTAMARARLDTGESPRLTEVRRIFRQEGPPSRGLHFGCRIVQARDGNLFLTTGDHFGPRDLAQTLDNHLGKVIRIAPDGSVPKDNPFVGKPGAKPEIWSYGHRNSQGATLHPVTGKLWMHEHGPQGGDEINIPDAGKNYGWPVIGYGVNYGGATIHEGTHKTGMEQPIRYWTPVIAPSGFTIYTGDLFPQWKGNAFIGGLRTSILVRLELDGEKVTREERMLRGLNERIRDVRTGPDGALYLVTDNSAGRILRLAPAK